MVDIDQYKQSELDKLQRGARHGVPDQIIAAHRLPEGRLAFGRGLELYFVRIDDHRRWEVQPLTSEQEQLAAERGVPVELRLTGLDPTKCRFTKLPAPRPALRRTGPYVNLRAKTPDCAELPRDSEPVLSTDCVLATPEPSVARSGSDCDPLDSDTWPRALRRAYLHQHDPWRHHFAKERQQRRLSPQGHFVLLRSRHPTIRDERRRCRAVTLLSHGPFASTAAAWIALKLLRRGDHEAYGSDVFPAYIGDEWDLVQVAGEPDLRMRSRKRWVETSPGMYQWRSQPFERNINRRKIERERMIPGLLHMAAHLGASAWEQPGFTAQVEEFVKLCPPASQRLHHQDHRRQGDPNAHLLALMESITRAPPYVRVIRHTPRIVLEAEGAWLVERIEGDFTHGLCIAMVKAARTWPENNGWRLVRLVREAVTTDAPVRLPLLVGV